MSAENTPPVISVVRGEPNAEELAALVAVLAGRGGADEPETPTPISAWTDRSRYVRGRLEHHSGGWRASALPR